MALRRLGRRGSVRNGPAIPISGPSFGSPLVPLPGLAGLALAAALALPGFLVGPLCLPLFLLAWFVLSPPKGGWPLSLMWGSTQGAQLDKKVILLNLNGRRSRPKIEQNVFFVKLCRWKLSGGGRDGRGRAGARGGTACGTASREGAAPTPTPHSVTAPVPGPRDREGRLPPMTGGQVARTSERRAPT